MANIHAIEWGECVLEPMRNPERERYLRQRLGMVPDAFTYYLDSAWITRAAASFDLSQVPLTKVSFELAEMVALVVSQDNSCRYCFEATRGVLRVLGFSETRIRELEENLYCEDMSRVDRLALDLARRISRAAPLASRSDAAALIEAGFSEAAVKEIAFLCAVSVFYNRLSTLPALPPEPVLRFFDSWYIRAFRPFVSRWLRSRWKSGQPQMLSPEQRSGPFSAFVLALDGLPIAARLREVIDDAWASPVLPRRTKALVFAVVARGIGCPLSEKEAARLLGQEGLSAAHLERVLSTLSSPALDEVESAVVPFARETIRYEPIQIQRRAGEVRRRLDREQFVELVGIAGLANALCRLGIAVDVCRRTGADPSE